jgi:hypothetical protein
MRGFNGISSSYHPFYLLLSAILSYPPSNTCKYIVYYIYIMTSAGQRLSSVLSHLNPMSSESTGRKNLLKKNPDDIVCSLLSSVVHTNKTRSSHLQHELLSPKPRKEL